MYTIAKQCLNNEYNFYNKVKDDDELKEVLVKCYGCFDFFYGDNDTLFFVSDFI